MSGKTPVPDEERKAVLEDIKKAPGLFQPFLRRSVTDPVGFKRSILEAMPRMLFVLLPVFAAIVALFYHRRKYPEHLYFATHLHSFIFLALALLQLSRFTRTPAIIGVVAFVAYLSIPVYATLAFRQTYGGSVVGTLAKETGICILYFATSIIAFALMLYIVSLTG